MLPHRGKRGGPWRPDGPVRGLQPAAERRLGPALPYDEKAAVSGRPCKVSGGVRQEHRPAVLEGDELTGDDLGGLTLTDGTYSFSTSAQLTGTVTFDAQGDPNAVFIVQIGSTLTTASASSVSLVNGADACNIFWQVGSSATLGTDTAFQGSILALTSITLDTGATIEDGRALARNGAVTLDTNVITGDTCASTPAPTPTPTAEPTATPEPTAPGAIPDVSMRHDGSGTGPVALTGLVILAALALMNLVAARRDRSPVRQRK